MIRSFRLFRPFRPIALLAAGLAGIVLAGAAAPDPRAARVATVVEASGFAGEVLVGAGDRVLVDRWFGMPQIAADATPRSWPWQSVTKQVVATLVMQQVAAGKLALDAPADRYLPALKGAIAAPTLRQLLQHRSGLRNPDDTPPGKDGWPAFYTATGSPLGWCLGTRAAGGGEWRYNNCDYLVLGAILDRVTGQPLASLYAARIAAPLGLKSRFVGAGRGIALDWPDGVTPAERAILARFGAAGGLAGSARDLWKFDRALTDGKLLPQTARATLWAGDPALGYQALGQWSFEASLKGCAATVRIIERRGGIGRFQARNLILPDRHIAIIAFTNRADFDFGEIWQGKGFSYDMLSAAACS